MGVDLSDSHEAMDCEEHEKTYSLFIKLTIWLTILSIAVVAFLGIFFTN